MTSKLVQKITEVADLSRLKTIVSKIVGETCWRANLGYGDELILHIGTRIPYSHKSLSELEKGAWMFGVRESAWQLDSLGATLASSEDDSEVLIEQIRIVEGSIITSLEISYPDFLLIIEFDNLCRLTLIPDFVDNADSAYWELFTPDRMLVKFGPLTTWSYMRADIPAE